MVNFKIKKINFDTGREPEAYLKANSRLVIDEGLSGGLRIEFKKGNSKVVARVILTDSNLIKDDEVGFSSVAFNKLGLNEGEEVFVFRIPVLKSLNAIKEKMHGKEIDRESMHAIIKDIVDNYYATEHITAFCMACEGFNMTYNEILYLTEAMVAVGQKIKWDFDIVVDKHCIGGIPGNRTTNVVIPIVSAFGLHIPKTSSRAITSPSGTADTMEVLCNTTLSMDKMKEVVKKCNGCLVWGGSVNLSPADDFIINARKILNIDSEGQMVASVLSKKIAAGSTHALIVIPVGDTAKVKNEKDFQRLKKIFESIAKDLGLKAIVVREDGTQPIGNGIGPSLEAIDILKLFKNDPDAPQDLKEISLNLAGQIIEFSPNVKKGDGKKIEIEILESGKAYEKFMEIIKEQGDERKIPVAKITYDILAKNNGKVISINNRKISEICRLVGCPNIKSAGIFLYKHLNNDVKIGDKLYTIHTKSDGELNSVLKYINENDDIIIIK
jgi:thymidine phosphorylase